MSGAEGLRIAQLIESDGPGGAEQVVVDLATGLQAAGAQSVVFVPRNGEGWLARQLEGSGVAVEPFALERPLSPAAADGIAAALRRHGVHLAHGHEFSMAVYGAWASRLAGLPHLITMHGGRYYAGHLRRRLALRLAVASSGATVAVSSGLAAHLGRDLHVRPSRITVIPNGVRPRPADPRRPGLREVLGLGPDHRLLVSVGNLYPVKGHRHLLDALALLAPRHPRLHLAIAGRGHLEGALSARARQHGLARRVHLLGLSSDVPGVLAAADVFVLPSLSEGLPLALLEAMFAGCAIVASDVGDVGAALAHGDAGVLVPAGDSPALAAAIHGLLADPSRARSLGESAARRAASEYGQAQMLRRYGALYGELLARRGRTVALRAAGATAMK
jgi:glycosyltransferase involved in cell wall biosynthesis